MDPKTDIIDAWRHANDANPIPPSAADIQWHIAKREAELIEYRRQLDFYQGGTNPEFAHKREVLDNAIWHVEGELNALLYVTGQLDPNRIVRWRR